MEAPIALVLPFAAVLCFIATLAGLSLGRRLGSRLGDAAHGLASGVFVLLGVIVIVEAAASGTIGFGSK
jgi:putative Mn2+ efflux pump MntP